jgi:hypothetical protein
LLDTTRLMVDSCIPTSSATSGERGASGKKLPVRRNRAETGGCFRSLCRWCSAAAGCS